MVKGFKKDGKFHPTNTTVSQLSSEINEIENIRSGLGQQSSELFSEDDGTQIKKTMDILERKKQDIQKEIEKKRENKEDVSDTIAEAFTKSMRKEFPDQAPFPFRDKNFKIVSTKDDHVIFEVFSGSGDEDFIEKIGKDAGFKFIKHGKILDKLTSTFEGKL